MPRSGLNMQGSSHLDLYLHKQQSSALPTQMYRNSKTRFLHTFCYHMGSIGIRKGCANFNWRARTFQHRYGSIMRAPFCHPSATLTESGRLAAPELSSADA
eukprot:4107064-Pleurochrysis_carterae.AAC.3